MYSTRSMTTLRHRVAIDETPSSGSIRDTQLMDECVSHAIAREETGWSQGSDD